MNKLSRWLLWTLFSFILGIGVLVAILQNRATLQEKGRQWSSFIFSIDDYLAQPFLPLQTFVDNTTHLFATYDENEQLKRENVLLRLENSQLESLRAENVVLKEGLSFIEERSQARVIPASVRVRSPHKWYEQLIVNRGQDSGVEKGMLVLSETNVIGIVAEVQNKSSRVTLLTNDKQFPPLPVKVTSGSETLFGILSAYDETKEAFVMTQLSSSAPIEPSSQVFTSGLDGKSTADLPVGTVVAVEDNQDRLLRQVYLKSLVDVSNLSEVLLVGE